MQNHFYFNRCTVLILVQDDFSFHKTAFFAETNGNFNESVNQNLGGSVNENFSENVNENLNETVNKYEYNLLSKLNGSS